MRFGDRLIRRMTLVTCGWVRAHLHSRAYLFNTRNQPLGFRMSHVPITRLSNGGYIRLEKRLLQRKVRPFPSTIFPYNPSWHANRNAVVGYRRFDDTAKTDNRTVAYPRTAQHHSARAKPHMVPDHDRTRVVYALAGFHREYGVRV